MSREILQGIISDFSPDKFAKFFRAKNRSFSPQEESFSQYDDPAFADGVKFGEIQFSPDEKLIACAFKATQPLSERSSRKAQYEKGKKILKDTQSDAGIFIFYDSRGNFRFSLIYPEVIGTRRQWSNFRRFTYFVSPELTNKTFLTRVGDGDFSSLEKIKDAFSVEKVTKEFYEQYRKLFEALLGDLNKNRAFQIVASKSQINTPDFAKKLLGQIVFLYFLQKKGWLGVPQDKRWGDGDKNFISNLYKQAVKKSENFYNDYLEVLFYDTLNNASREGADPSFSKYFNCRIPFLNGGLFEPEYDWHGTKIYLENGIFKNIFETFDRYNFTVEEESPDDKEVAVDPEMLGKVFENLLEENLRKGKGTYYTPREIVHYMCRESLVNYLVSQSGFEEEKVRGLILRHESGFSTDEGKTLEQFLKDVKICDPACGSGAFLVGMLTEIVGARLVLDPAGSEYGLKKETIQNCIYGVDIDPGAVEIAKLRLWLSLVVDYELADIEPLPNLDYKIMCGNSLLEELIVGDESISLFDPGVLGKDKPKRKSSDKLMQMDFLKQDAEEYLKILRKLHVEYFHETDTQKKKTLRSRIEKIEMDFIQASVDSRVKEIDGWIKNLNMQKPEDRKKNAELMTKKLEYLAIPSGIRESKVRPYFLWHLNFFEVFQEKGGFDVVIANPPYVRQERIKELKPALAQQYRCYNAVADIYVYFYERSVGLLRLGGALAFITSNKYFRSSYGKSLRGFLSEQTTLHHVIDFGDASVFEAMAYPSIVILTKNPTQTNKTRVMIWKAGPPIENFAREFQASSFCIPQKELTPDGWRLESLAILRLLEKLGKVGQPLVEYVNGRFYRGIITGLNDAWVVNRVTRDRLITAHKSSAEILKPFLRGRDVKRWRVEFADQYLVKIESSGNKQHPWSGKSEKEAERVFAKTYPAIHAHFQSLRQIKLEKPDDRGCRNMLEKLQHRDDQGKYYWELRSCNYWEEFYKTMIAWGNLATAPQFTIVESGYFISAPATFLVSDSKFLLGLLNSQVTRYVVSRSAAERQGGFLEFKPMYISPLAIPVATATEQARIARLADSIIAAKKSDPRLEHEIDQMIYKLYGLTEEEIKIVEGDSSAQSASELVKNHLDKAGSV